MYKLLILSLLFTSCNDWYIFNPDVNQCEVECILDECGICNGPDNNNDGYCQLDLDFLEDIFNLNDEINTPSPGCDVPNILDIGTQIWDDGRLRTFLFIGQQQYPFPICSTPAGNGGKILVIPESIINLKFLSELYLTDNLFTSLPEGIVNLNNLSLLTLDSNNLIELPENLCDLPDNCIIDVAGNALCDEYNFDCINRWETSDFGNNLPQDQSNCP